MAATLKSRLPAINAELRPRVSAAVKASAELVAERAQQRAPYGPGVVHIREHFKVERVGAAEYRVYNDARAETGSEAPYAHMVEFGTAHSAAQPFLVPALEDSVDAAENLVTAALRGL